MCRSMRPLRWLLPPAAGEEVRAAALQDVRKISGYRQPSRRNAAAFEQAVAPVAAATERLLAAVGGRGDGEPRPG